MHLALMGARADVYLQFAAVVAHRQKSTKCEKLTIFEQSILTGDVRVDTQCYREEVHHPEDELQRRFYMYIKVGLPV